MLLQISYLIPCLALLLFSLAGCSRLDSTATNKEEVSGLHPVSIDDRIDKLREIAREQPQDLIAWIRLGNLLMDSGRFTEAINAFQRALSIAPDNADVRVDMASCYRYAGDAEKAVELYREALVLDHTHLLAHKNLGIVLAYDLDRVPEGLKEFEAYLKLSPGGSDAEAVRQVIRELSERI